MVSPCDLFGSNILFLSIAVSDFFFLIPSLLFLPLVPTVICISIHVLSSSHSTIVFSGVLVQASRFLALYLLISGEPFADVEGK
jgi:hypothetical protein